MKILYGTMLVTIMILTAYLVVIIERNIPAINSSILESQKALAPLQEQFAKQQETLELLQTELSGLHKEINERIAKEEQHIQAVQSVRAALAKIEEAEAVRKQGDLNKAAEILLATKQPLWKSGNAFPAEQAAFHGLMMPIDTTVAKWKSGNGAVDAAKVAGSVRSILGKISR